MEAFLCFRLISLKSSFKKLSIHNPKIWLNAYIVMLSTISCIFLQYVLVFN